MVNSQTEIFDHRSKSSETKHCELLYRSVYRGY